MSQPSTVSTQDRGFTLGDGVFDTALALGGVVMARARHVERLHNSAQAIGISIERNKIEVALDEAMTPAPQILRTTITRGIAGRGLWPNGDVVPTLVVGSAPWSPSLIGQPARLAIATGRRNSLSNITNLKTLNYLDHILAAREAAKAGVEDALMLNIGGRVACSTIANVFALKQSRLATPPLIEGCLPGVMRGILLETAPMLGFEPVETALTVEELMAADAVFLTNSVRFLRPVTAIDGQRTGTAPEATDRLLRHLLDLAEAECRVRLP
ncbi:aminotransferase class IV [Ancylobacter sp. 6x-1]|uniref:Probable branched-chain-amino-acid aminotransferase n=1 Tax=Ancylobacter crimeensis TaxID=2579147 RepID=A0ABT0DA52_9HYPH|nr:aminotransferase class IV [Ancylobacter crimeensis]